MNARRLAVALSKWSLTFAFLLSAAAAPAQPAEAPKLSDEQIARGYRLDEVAAGVWRIRFGEPEKLTPVTFQEHPAAAERPGGPGAVRATAAENRGHRLPPQRTRHRHRTAAGRRRTALRPGHEPEGVSVQGRQEDRPRQRRPDRTVLGDSHAPAPFYVSTRGYGVYVDTARYASFYFGNLYAVRERVAAKPAGGGPLGPDRGRCTARRSSGRSWWASTCPAARGVDVYVFGGPDMRHAVQRYNLFSGGGCLPPMWGLGVWYRASTELGQQEVLNFLQEFRQRHIPCDVFGLEPGWHSHAYPCSFVWNPGTIPIPTGCSARRSQQGYKLNLWEHGFTHPEFAALQAAVALERRLQGLGRPGARFRHARGPQNLRRPPRKPRWSPRESAASSSMSAIISRSAPTPGRSPNRRPFPPGWTASRCTC